MKKLNLLVILALVAGLLLAAVPAGKLMRLEIVNKTDQTVYLKLEGKETEAFYYLSVEGDTDKTFTVVSDVYKRTTWTCDGVKSTGDLFMTGNVRLVFTPCGMVPMRKEIRWYFYDNDLSWTITPGDEFVKGTYYMPNFGEPTQEKIFYFKEYSFVRWTKLVDPVLLAGIAGEEAGLYLFFWTPDAVHRYWVDNFTGHYTVWLPMRLGVAWRTYKGPIGLWWRYQY